jgi:transposase
MSLQAQPIPPIPELTIRIARAAFRKGNVYMQMRDLLGTFFTDDQFADLYPADGQPAYAPWRLALVSVMQFAENLTDRQAADAVRSRIDWKYVLSLELTDEGFDFSVLSEFRQRLVTHEAGERLLNEMLAQFVQAGLLSSGGKQRTDSTYVVASVRALNRLELVGRTLQAALDAVAALTPEWLRAWAAPEWYTHYSQPLTTFRLPQKSAERDELAVQIGWDGLTLMETIYHDPVTPAIVRELEAVEILRQVWVQQYVLEEGNLRWRTREEMPPAARLIQSPFDLDAHYSRKRTTEWVGYKVHLTETCNDDTPNLITHVLTTDATEQDVDAVEPVHEGLERINCLPDDQLVDMGYTSAPLLYDSREDYGVELVGPLWEKQTWQHANGYGIDAFMIDWEERRAICPEGKVSQQWSMREPPHDHKLIRVKFRAADCKACPVHNLCTRNDRRTLSFHEQPVYEAAQQRKQEQHTEEFHIRYGKRAGVEGTISQSVFALGMRRSRYRGLEKTHLQHVFTAMAMNITRVLNWYNEVPRSQTRVTRFGQLAA